MRAYAPQRMCWTAQHATATCCRKCLAKWHQIPKGKELSAEQLDYLVAVIERWLKSQSTSQEKHAAIGWVQQRLFG